MRPLITLAALAVFCSGFVRQARAQTTTGSLTGQVLEREGRTPAEGVTVTASGPQGDVATLTGRDGFYLLRGLPVGTYVLRFFSGETLVERPGVFVAANAIRTPMSGGIVAYGDRAAAEQAAATHQGAVITSVDALLKRSGGEK